MIAAKEYMGIPKRDQMVARVQDARDSQTAAKEQFKSALDEFLAVTKASGGELEAKYKKFSSEYDASEAAAAKVSSRIADVERVSTALFKEWEKEIGTLTNPAYKADAQKDLTESKASYEKLHASMKTAEGKMAPVLATFKEQVTYLKLKLNARAIAGLQGTVQQVSMDVDKLIADMNTSINEANAYINQLQATKN
ncbi:MAG: DUF2959 domain-containing protein [Planctomycetes bacterium]|nr:DUF2959 domain-containing protein [Planctomycetota bacterium]